MIYKVIEYFTDLQDNNHPYNVGDIFPRKGVEVTAERIAELASNKNRQGMPLISPVEAKEAVPVSKSPAKKTVRKSAKK